MTLQAAIYSLLSGATAVTDIVGTRIRPVQGHIKDNLPYVSYSIIREEIYEESEAASKSRENVVQFDLYGTNADTLDTLANAIHTALVRKHGTVGDLTEVTIFRTDNRTSNEFATQGENQAPYHRMLDFSVQYNLP